MPNRAIIEQLQKQILSLEGHRQQPGEQARLGLEQIEDAFPDKVFPRAAVHEWISESPTDASCTNGFISVILGKLMLKGGYSLWIGSGCTIFPPALKMFGIEPEQILFIDATKAKDALWAVEEALKCNALTSVVGEIGELSFNDSRRLQLAVEQSRVTGLIHRHMPKSLNAVACVSRWKITPAPGFGTFPGVGFPGWKVQLLKVRNGKPGEWLMQWSPAGLTIMEQQKNSTQESYNQNQVA